MKRLVGIFTKLWKSTYRTAWWCCQYRILLLINSICYVSIASNVRYCSFPGDVTEQKYFSPLENKLHFHLNFSKKHLSY